MWHLQREFELGIRPAQLPSPSRQRQQLVLAQPVFGQAFSPAQYTGLRLGVSVLAGEFGDTLVMLENFVLEMQHSLVRERMYRIGISRCPRELVI